MSDYELREPECINLVGEPNERDHLSHSSLDVFLACQQKFSWHYEHRLDPAVVAAPLALGKAFATALEKGDPEIGENMLRWQADEQAQRHAGNPWVNLPTSEEIDIQATTVRCAATAYLDAYGQHNETREVELRARIRNPVAGGRYSLTHDLLGRVDALDTAGRVLFEDKLVSQIPRSSLASKLTLDRQVTIGCYLAWRCLGIEISEVRYRMTLKPTIRRKQTEAHDEFLARIASDYIERPEHYLVEEVCTRSPDDFLRLEQELWEWAESVRRARRSGVWPRNTAHCHAWNGCQYIPLCAREPGADKQFVERPERAVAA